MKMMKGGIYWWIVVLALLLLCESQRRGKKQQETPINNNIFSTIANILLPGNPNTPILQRLFSKIGFYASAIVGSIIGYFAFFRKNKQRNQKINAYLGQWKQKMILDAKDGQKFNKVKADKIIYHLNFEKQRKMEVKSANGRIQYNITVNCKQAQEDSHNMYHIKMEGQDPEGKSDFFGFVTFKNEKMLLSLAQTHLKHQKKQQSPVCYFEGKQKDENQQVVQGEWWIQGQKASGGDYCGAWKLYY